MDGLGVRCVSDRPWVTAAETCELVLTLDAIGRSADAMGLKTMRLPSGAGHDAQDMARLGPVGMIFIPSVGGISHSPKEFSRPKDIENGAKVLAISRAI